MDSQRVEELHREASEHYLQGRFEDAAKAWGEILRLAPDDERAREGLALAREMAQAQPEWENAHAEGAGPEDDLEAGLVLLDRLAPSPQVDSAASPHEIPPETLQEVETIPLAEPVPRDEPGRGTDAWLAQGGIVGEEPIVEETVEDVLEDPAPEPGGGVPENLPPEAARAGEVWEQPPPEPSAPGRDAATAPPSAGDAHMLEPRSLREPPRAGGEVFAELQRRVRSLMQQARAAAGAGETAKALDLVARVLILDEENQEALELEETLRQRQKEEARQIEESVAEGIHWLEQGKLEDAIGRFEDILKRHPAHREAREYLGEARKRLANVEASGEVPADTEKAESVESIPLARPARQAADAGEPAQARATDVLEEPPPPPPRHWAQEPPAGADRRPARRPAPPAPATAAAPSGRRFGALGLLAVVVLLAAGAGGFLVFSGWLPLARSQVTPSFYAAGAAQPAAELPETLEGGASPTQAQDAAAAPGGSEDIAGRIAAALEEARQAERRADYAAAIVAYDKVLDLEPGNAEAREGLRVAAERYREQKELADRIELARVAFAEGDYAEALRIFYRLPEGALPEARLARYKANGWYNLAVLSLRAGDTGGALEQLDEALAVQAGDRDAERLRAFAQRYDGRAKDAAYYETVYELRVRALDD